MELCTCTTLNVHFNELYICAHVYVYVVYAPGCTCVCICTCLCGCICGMQLQVPFISFFVAVFAGPEAIRQAHPTSEPCPSSPVVVKNGQLACVSLGIYEYMYSVVSII